MNNSLIPEGWLLPKRVTWKSQRGAQSAEVQIVCGAGDYELDVIVRPHEGLEILGQVTFADLVYEPATDLDIDLVRAGVEATEVRARTNDLGEFDMHSECEATYGLRVGGPDAPCILIWEGIRRLQRCG